MLTLSIIGSIFPMLIYLYFLWKFDKNEPEPIKYVFYHFIFGATVAILLGIIGSKMLSSPLKSFFNEQTNNLIKIILIAPFVEEIAKASFLFKTIKNKNIDNLTDGLIYGGAIGLGFGMTENFFYFLLYGDSLPSFIPLFIIRTSFSSVMHCLSTALVGGIMSLTKYSSKTKFHFSTFFALLTAMFIHFTWNASVIFPNTYFVGIIFIIIVLSLFIFTYYLSLKYESKIIYKELANEIPENILNSLTSLNKFKNGLFANTSKLNLLEKATLLAFRKHQVEISGKNNELYIKEIDQLRNDISELIKIENNLGPINE